MTSKSPNAEIKKYSKIDSRKQNRRWQQKAKKYFLIVVHRYVDEYLNVTL
jgi:hypothetical protein